MRSVALAAAWGALVAGCGRDASHAGEPGPPAAPTTRVEAEVDVRAQVALSALRVALADGAATRMPIEEARGFEEIDGALVPRLPLRGVKGVAQTVRLPLRADGAWTVGARGLWIDVALRGAANVVGSTTAGAVVYEHALDETSTLFHVPLVTGTEELLRLERPSRREVRYDVGLHGVAGLRLSRGVLEVLDARGTPVLRTSAPIVVDADRRQTTGSLAIEGCAFDTSAELPFGRAPTPPGADRCTVVSRWDDAGLAYPIIVDPGWTTTARLLRPREDATATSFINAGSAACSGGCVLVVGGADESSGLTAQVAELYSVAAGSWTLTDDPPTPTPGWSQHAAAETGDGRVIVAGGSAGAMSAIYDPSLAAGAKWTVARPLPSGARAQLEAAHFAYQVPPPLRPGHTIAFVGGETGAASTPTSAIDLYDVKSGTWNLGGALTLAVPRYKHAAVAWQTPCAGICPKVSMLAVAGGITTGFVVTDSVEVFNLQTKSSVSLHLSVPRLGLSGVFADGPDGAVLFAGGTSALGLGVGNANVDALSALAPTAVTKVGTLSAPRGFLSGAAFTGTDLVAHAIFSGGGVFPDVVTVADHVDVEPAFSSAPTSPMHYPRAHHRVVALADGSVLAVGGFGNAAGSAPAMEELLVAGPAAAACAADGDCASLHCVDGVCCDRACNGQCEACDDPSSVGTCIGVAGAPHGSRPACAGGDPKCGSRCDPATPSACVFPTTSTRCVDPSCADGAANPASFCNGSGGCRLASPVPCGNYACAAGECKLTCAGDGDCAKGFLCDGATKACVPKTSSCTADGLGSLPADRLAAKPCGAYRCNPSSGDCYAACTDSGECAPGSVCDGGACVTPAGGAATLDLPGCGVSSGGGGVAPGAVGLLGALAGLGLVRRRARRALSDSSS